MPALATGHRQLSLLELLAIVTMCSMHMGLIAADANVWTWLMLAFCVSCLAMMQLIPSQFAASERMARIFLVFAFLSVVSLIVMDVMSTRPNPTKRPTPLFPIATPPECFLPVAPVSGGDAEDRASLLWLDSCDS